MLKNIYTYIKKLLRIKTKNELIEEYLAASASLYDLERRIKELANKGII